MSETEYTPTTGQVRGNYAASPMAPEDDVMTEPTTPAERAKWQRLADEATDGPWTAAGRNKVDTDALRKAAEAATPGPWEIRDGDGAFDVPVWAEGDYLCFSPDDGVRGGHSLADAEFIAAANPATVLALLDEVENLRCTVDADLRYQRKLEAKVGRLEDEIEALEADGDHAIAERDAALAEVEELRRIVNGYDRTPAEQRAADAEAERDAALAKAERWRARQSEAAQEAQRMRERYEAEFRAHCVTMAAHQALTDAVREAINQADHIDLSDTRTPLSAQVRKVAITTLRAILDEHGAKL